jgi:acetamidase/formamidase
MKMIETIEIIIGPTRGQTTGITIETTIETTIDINLMGNAVIEETVSTEEEEEEEMGGQQMFTAEVEELARGAMKEDILGTIKTIHRTMSIG